MLIAFVIYLIIHDIPNPEYGIFSFKSFIEETVARFSSSHTNGVGDVVQWVRM